MLFFFWFLFFCHIFITETFANSADPDVMPHITLSCPVMPTLPFLDQERVLLKTVKT